MQRCGSCSHLRPRSWEEILESSSVKSLKVHNRQKSWKDGQIRWEAHARHVEILAKQLGMESSSPVKTPPDKNDADKMFRYRKIDGEDGAQGGETACYVDEIF